MGKNKPRKDKGKANTNAVASSHHAAVVSGDDEAVQENVVQPVFTYNNKPHFPTSCTTTWQSTFKIEMGEALYKVDEVSGDDVLCVSKYTKNLDELLRSRIPNDVVTIHGNIRALANLSREVCKGIVKAFGKLMECSSEKEPMWLDSLYNYRLCGVEVYHKPLSQGTFQGPLTQNLDNFSTPIEVIIIKDDQTQAPQRTCEAKFKSICDILELVCPQEFYNKEWKNMLGYLSTDNYNNNCCAQLPLSEHWVFWHWERRLGFYKYCHDHLIKEVSQIVQVFSCAFDNISFFDSKWETVFRADPPLDSVWKHVTTGVASQGGAHRAGSSNVAAGSSSSGGGGALSRSRRENGKKFIIKTRNCEAHVTEYKPTYYANGIFAGYVYTNIDQSSPTDVYYQKRSYLPLRLLEKFPDLFNDLVPAVRNAGFLKY